MLKLKRMMSCSASLDFDLFAQAANFGSVSVDQSKRCPTHVPAAIVWISACDDRMSVCRALQSGKRWHQLLQFLSYAIGLREQAGLKHVDTVMIHRKRSGRVRP